MLNTPSLDLLARVHNHPGLFLATEITNPMTIYVPKNALKLQRVLDGQESRVQTGVTF
jgi:hypothetical protein